MKILIGAALILLLFFIMFALGIVTGVAIMNAKEEQENERH